MCTFQGRIGTFKRTFSHLSVRTKASRFVMEKLKAQICPSILNFDLSNLAKECSSLIADSADYLHLDVMDGHFVPDLTFGPLVVKALRNTFKEIPMEVHMMVSKPEQWVKAMGDAGMTTYTFHYEATEDPAGLCKQIKETGMRVGMAIKPGTSVDVIVDYVGLLDMVLIMTVEPGFGGQKFMKDMMSKVTFIRENFPHLDIEVDGGVGLANIEICAAAGANQIVSGTAILKATDRKATMDSMRATVQSHIDRRINLTKENGKTA